MILEKEIKVSDPEYWQSETVEVQLYNNCIYVYDDFFNSPIKEAPFVRITIGNNNRNLLEYYEMIGNDSIKVFALFERLTKEIYDKITNGANKESIMNLGFKEI